MNNQRSLFLIAGLAVVILLIIWLTSFQVQPLTEETNYPPDINTIACPMDAKVCPDGTTLGRVSPDCQFPACPENSLEGLDLAAELAKCLPQSDQASRQICQQLLDKIQDFETCALAGFPIREIYPEQCVTPDERLFIKQY